MWCINLLRSAGNEFFGLVRAVLHGRGPAVTPFVAEPPTRNLPSGWIATSSATSAAPKKSTLKRELSDCDYPLNAFI